jgi:hypothetical protein
VWCVQAQDGLFAGQQAGVDDAVVVIHQHVIEGRAFAEVHHDFDLAWQALGVEVEGGFAFAIENRRRTFVSSGLSRSVRVRRVFHQI